MTASDLPATLGGAEPAPRPCPVCGSVRHEVLYEQRFEHFTAGSIADGYTVVACRQCGMCFATGLPDQERFSEYYGGSSKYDMSAEGAEVSRYEQDRCAKEARFIASHVVDRASPILDIGTATGGLLLALRELGFSSLHGVEPSPEAARKARDTYGLDVIAGDVRAAKVWNDGFSVVSFVAVLEHLVDPASSLQEMVRLLKADGVIYLLVPDASSFSNHVDAPYQEFSVEHVNYFTSASLANLLASVGVEVVAERATVFAMSPDSDGPAIEVLCRPTKRALHSAFDSFGVDRMRDYIARSAEKEAGVHARIAELASSQQPILVWGTGTNSLHLLATSRLAECNIVAFLESNPHYVGHRLANREVISPRDVQRVDLPILIASAASQTAIATAARGLFGPDVPLILMY